MVTARNAGAALALVLGSLALSHGAPAAEAPSASVLQIQYRDDRGYDRGYDRGGDRGYDRGYDRGNDRGYDRGGYGGGGGGAPGGTYLRSCGDARREGSTLVAVCRGDRGRRFETSLDLSRCGRSDIGNNGGTLECAGTRGRSRRID